MMRAEVEGAVSIRLVSINDIPFLIELVSQIESDEDLTQSAEAQFYKECEGSNNEVCRFVAVLGQKIVGTMGCGPGPMPSSMAVWADWLVVDKDFRKHGVASLLYAGVEAHARRLNRKLICLDIGNIDRERAAYEFHSKNGFQVIGQIADYWGDQEHLHIMVKRLSA